ncbi:metallophosphoesterase [Helcococcus kunzii]
MDKIILGIFLFLIIFIIYIFYDNAHPKKEILKIKKKMPESVDKLRILQISDLHNQKFGENQERLLNLIDDNYDLIFITGDLIDRRYTNITEAMNLVNNLKCENIFYIKGNHEKGAKDYPILEKELLNSGIKVLDNKNFSFRDINICGVDDPAEYITLSKKKDINEYKVLEENIKTLLEQSYSKFNILLSHRPEYFDLYVKYNIDLVFSGHSHGGQVRIFGKGLYSASQGFFGEYVGGVYKKGNTTMVNSRGLGNNFPFAKRIFNTPQIIEIILENEKSSL